MKKTNRILALLLAAAIMLGFYVPATQAQAATAIETVNFGFTEENRASEWSVNPDWVVADGKLVTDVDINQLSGASLSNNRASAWGDFTATIDVTVYPQGVDTKGNSLNYTSFGVRFYSGGSSWLRLQVAHGTTGATVSLYHSGTGKSLASKNIYLQTSADSQNYTLTITTTGRTIKATVGYKNILGSNSTATLNADLTNYPDVQPGGLVLQSFRSFVPGTADNTLAQDGLYCSKADVNSFQAEVYTYNVINNVEVANPVTYEDSFSNDTLGQNPDYWIEDNNVDAFTVAGSPSSAAAEGCVAPSGNAYKYTGTDYARSWLHVFETNVHYTAKIFVPEGTTSGQVGLLVRTTGLEVPGLVKVGYDFAEGVWFVEDGRGAVSDFGNPYFTSQEGTMAAGQWHTVRAYVVNRTLKLYCDDMNTPVMTAPVYQTTPGRVGLFAEGLTEAYFDDVNLKLLSGQGRVEPAVLENYVLDPSSTGYTEGGSMIRYDENTLLLNTANILFESKDNGDTFVRLDMSKEENKKYSFFVMGLTQYIRLHNGYLLKLVTTNGNVTTVLSKDNGATATTVNKKMYNTKLDGVITSVGQGYYGGMNDMVKEINLGDIDGDGQDNYRVFYCADVRTTGKEGNLGTDITYHWQEVYYTDDFGYTWNKADFDTRWYSGLDHICESKIMPVYNEDGSFKCVRIFCTWNDGRTVRYFDSYDYGQTWTSEKAIPELTGGRNSFAYAIDKETGYIYIAYPYGVPANDEDIFPRNRFALMRSKDATNWEYVMDLWRWEDIPTDEHTNINQVVDPSMTIDGDYIYVTSGWSEWQIEGTPHNAQRQTMIRLDKNKLTAYDAFPITPDNKAITHVEVTAPQKRNYLLNEEIDLTGGYLTVYYYDGSTKQVSLTDASVSVSRPDADWRWTSEFDTTVYPLTGKAGMQWIRVEYTDADSGFNDGFANGFFVYVAETEEELVHILEEGITESHWDAPAEGQEDLWRAADGALVAEFAASDALTGITRLITDSYKWSGYSISANLTSYAQTDGAYAQTSLVMGNYQLRIQSLGATGCTVILRDTVAGTAVATQAVKYSAITPVDGGLSVDVQANYLGNALHVSVNGVHAFTYEVDAITGSFGFFVFRNGPYSGPLKASLNSLKVTAPTVRNFYDAALEDKISLNIHMGLTQAEAQDPGVFMKFILNGVQTLAKATIGENNDFAFTAHIAAKEMADTIIAQLYNSMDGMIAQHTTTLKDYASYIINTDGYKQRDKDIAAALLNYGAAAQLHFKHNTENLANGGFTDGWNSGIDVSKLAKYAPKATGSLPAGVEFYGSSLIMEDRTTIRHYFKMDAQTAQSVRASLYGQTLTLLRSGNFYYVDVTGVDAANLDYAFTVELTDGTNTYAVTYSALSYVYQILSSENYNGTTMAQLAQALYLYNKAVDLEPGIGDDEFEILPF